MNYEILNDMKANRFAEVPTSELSEFRLRELIEAGLLKDLAQELKEDIKDLDVSEDPERPVWVFRLR